MRGKLIVLEGTDGSGKATQTRMLVSRLQAENMVVTPLSFPRYDKPSSKLVQMYLYGAFGDDPKAVSPYEASKFYAIDRYCSFVEDWGKTYEEGGVIVTDRYTTANAVHQASKMSKDDRYTFFRWLSKCEYEDMGIPEPDLVIYLDMPLDVTEKLMRQREDLTATKADIHEKDMEYLAQCKEAAMDAALYYGWHIIRCAENGEPKSVEKIHEEVYEVVKILFG